MLRRATSLSRINVLTFFATQSAEDNDAAKKKDAAPLQLNSPVATAKPAELPLGQSWVSAPRPSAPRLTRSLSLGRIVDAPSNSHSPVSPTAKPSPSRIMQAFGLFNTDDPNTY